MGDIFGVGMAMEVVHIFRHHYGADGFGDGRGGVSVGHFFLFAFPHYLLPLLIIKLLIGS